MNGISVMACVQTNHSGFRSIYGKEDRIQQKYITISRQNEQKSPGKTAGRDAGRNVKTAKNDKNDKNVKNVKNINRAESGQRQSSGHDRKASAGRRGTSFVIRTFVLAVIFAAMLAGFQMMTRASSREKEQTYKYYTTVTIGYGEDLSDIVFQYCDSSKYESADAYVREICDINSLPYHKGSVPDLKAGARIVIPYYSAILK